MRGFICVALLTKYRPEQRISFMLYTHVLWYLSGINLTPKEKKLFVAASASGKQTIILDQSTSAEKAEEYLSLCGVITICLLIWFYFNVQLLLNIQI